MPGILRKLSSTSRILFFGFILILIPVAIISYLNLRSLNQKAENIQTKYDGTIRLVKDKLENEIMAHESNLRNSFYKLAPDALSKARLQQWIDSIEQQIPVFEKLILAGRGGGFLTGWLSYGWEQNHLSISPVRDINLQNLLSQAEKSEHIDKNFNEAIRLYQLAYRRSENNQDKTIIKSNIGRCYVKSGHFDKALSEYREIIDNGNSEALVGDVPATAAAWSQIAYIYSQTDEEEMVLKTAMQMHKYLLENSWDLESGSYVHYIRSASDRIKTSIPTGIDSVLSSEIDQMILKENELLESKVEIERIAEMNIPKEDIPGIIVIPAGFSNSNLSALSYSYNKDAILESLFPEILQEVELGKDVVVGLLDERDSLLYSQAELTAGNYLASEKLDRITNDWKVALFDPGGKSVEKLVRNEKTLYLFLFIAIILATIAGLIVLVRAVYNESRINRLKSEFVSNVSHELKTPLALIRMFGETLESGIVEEEEKKQEFYGIIRKESERLTQLVNNVLDFSRMDAGVKQFNFQTIDLVSIIKSSIEAYQFHIRDKGFEIDTDLPEEEIIINIDRDAISQAVLNLLSNAVKYSDEEKYIKVGVYRENDQAKIMVSDRGVGIPRDELKRVFEKFYQVPAGKGKEFRGSGLGLTITKQIIEAHNGTIEVESEKGKGCTFNIRIPS